MPNKKISRSIKTSDREGKAPREAIVAAVRELKSERVKSEEAVRYDIADKIIEEYFPKQSKNGGTIEFYDWSDCGELHHILEKFYQAVKAHEGVR